MFRKRIDRESPAYKHAWVKFEDALAELPVDKIVFPKVVAEAHDEGKRLWLKDEMNSIESEYRKFYPSEWYGAKYILSVSVPDVDNPYEKGYKAFVFMLQQGESDIWVFAHREATVNSLFIIETE